MYTIVRAVVNNGHHIQRPDMSFMPNIKGSKATFTLDAAQAIVKELNLNSNPFRNIFEAFRK